MSSLKKKRGGEREEKKKYPGHLEIMFSMLLCKLPVHGSYSHFSSLKH